MWRTIWIALVTMSLTGCAGLFFAGAATTVNYVTDPRSTEQLWQDNRIEFEVAALGNKAPYKETVRIFASSFNGQVVLLGQIPDLNLSREIETQVRQMKGVKSVHNRTKNKAPLDIKAISQDTWITTKVKSALLAEKDLNGIKVRVFTEDSEVFLFGYLTRPQADKATEVSRHITGVQQVVRAFQYAPSPIDGESSSMTMQ